MRTFLLFDLDGTLTDPKEGITRSVQYALSAMGIEEEDREKLCPFIGPQLAESFREFYGFDQEQARRAVREFQVYFRERGKFENRAYEGIDEMLGRLKEAGFTLAVATSKPEVFARQILEHFGLLSYFTAVFGADLEETRVRKGEIIADALAALGADAGRDRIRMIGDRRHDVEGAHENGIPCVAVEYGYGSQEEFDACGADWRAGSVRELEELLLSAR